MADPEARFFILENRISSFSGSKPATKSRGSSASSRANTKALRWPHKSPAPEPLAHAGFYFAPQTGSPDNVTCFLCGKNFDGWDADDSPLEEHLKHSPDCGWALTTAIEVELGEYAHIHPLDPALIEARKATFAGRWPYESKKTFKCKTKQLVDAGWKYTPTLESDDMATCVYCHLALDGWEASDKPFDEHFKRVPDCPFFVRVQETLAKKKKGGRASKTARLSTQSIASVMSDMASITDVTAMPDDSLMSTMSSMSKPPVAKKATRARKAPAAPKGRKTKAKKDEVIEVHEDEPAETEEAPPPPPKPTRGRKRASEAVEDSVVSNAEAPAPKKRATRAKKGSQAAAAAAPDVSTMTAASQDVDMMDPEPAPAKPTAARKRAARDAPAKKTAPRKAASQSSTRSQSPGVSLSEQMPDNDELDRQLQADLERPLTDDDDEDVVADSEPERDQKTKAPPPARTTKGRTKKATAAPEEEEMHAKQPQSQDYEMFDPTPVQPDEAAIDAELRALQAEVQAEEEQQVDTRPLHVPTQGRKTGTRKAPKQSSKKAKEQHTASQPVDESMDETAPGQAEEVAAVDVTMESVSAVEPDMSTEMVGAKSRTVVESESGASNPPAKKGRGRPPKKSATAAARASDEHSTHEASRQSEAHDATSAQLKDDGDNNNNDNNEKAVPAPAQAPVDPPSIQTAPPHSPPYRTTTSRAPPSDQPPVPESPAKNIVMSLRPPNTPHAHLTPSASAKQATISPSQSPQSSDAENQPPSSKPSSASASNTARAEAAAAAAAAGAAVARAVTTVAGAEAEAEAANGGGVAAVAKRVTIATGQPVLAAVTTPVRGRGNNAAGDWSPSKTQQQQPRNVLAGLQSTTPWTAIDLQTALMSPSARSTAHGGGGGDENTAAAAAVATSTATKQLLLRKGAELTSPEQRMTVEEWIFHNAGLAERRLRDECEAMVTRFESEGSRAMRVLEGLVAE